MLVELMFGLFIKGGYMDFPTVGKLVTYKNKDYVVVSEDYDCGVIFHILGLVKANKYHARYLRAIYVEEREGNVVIKSE
jgi:hypothetical protein